MEETGKSKIDTGNSKLGARRPECEAHEQVTGERGAGTDTPNPEARIPNRDSARSSIVNHQSAIPIPGAGEPLPARQAWIREGALAAVRDLFEKAIADPSSDAYRMIEIMCLNELVEVQLKTREMDALGIFKARNHGKEVELKAARLQSQNKLAEAQTSKLRLQIRVLENTIAQITEKALQARQAKREGRQFDYDQALNQICALLGLRGPGFRHDELEGQPN